MTTTMDHHKFIIYQCLCEAGQTIRTACLPVEEGVGVMGVGGGRGRGHMTWCVAAQMQTW